jgi:hypothetical protein
LWDLLEGSGGERGEVSRERRGLVVKDGEMKDENEVRYSLFHHEHTSQAFQRL